MIGYFINTRKENGQIGKYCCLDSVYCSVDVNHSIEECPGEHIGEQSAKHSV